MMNILAQHTPEQPSLAEVVNVLSSEVSKGNEMLNVAKIWLAEKGMAFAVNVLFSLVILLVGILIIRLGTRAIERALVANKHINSLMEKFLTNVANKICWVLLIMIVMQRLGLNIGPLIAGFGVTGFILGFAFQESLSNLAAGMMIGINEPFKIGDYISAGSIEGTVKDLNMMATTLSTKDNKKVVIPNKIVWGAPITNFSALGTRRMDIVVGISYGADISKAKSAILAAVKGVNGVLPNVEPIVGVTGIGDSAINLVVRPWCASKDYWGVLSASNQAVKEALDAAGIDIPFPQIVVHSKEG